jgi:hypothetical protein
MTTTVPTSQGLRRPSLSAIAPRNGAVRANKKSGCGDVADQGLAADRVTHHRIAEIRIEDVDDDHDVVGVASGLAERPAQVAERRCGGRPRERNSVRTQLCFSPRSHGGRPTQPCRPGTVQRMPSARADRRRSQRGRAGGATLPSRGWNFEPRRQPRG